MSDDGSAQAAQQAGQERVNEAREPIKKLPAGAPYVLGAIFVAQIIFIALVGATSLKFGGEVADARAAAAAAAETAKAYAAYAECLTDAASRRERAEQDLARAACKRPQ